MQLPSVSTTSAMCPYGPMENLGLNTLPLAASTRPCSTAQSSQEKYTSVPPPPEGAPCILTSAPVAPLVVMLSLGKDSICMPCASPSGASSVCSLHWNTLS